MKKKRQLIYTKKDYKSILRKSLSGLDYLGTRHTPYIASRYAAAGEIATSRKIFEDYALKKPDDLQALLGLMSIAIEDKDNSKVSSIWNHIDHLYSSSESEYYFVGGLKYAKYFNNEEMRRTIYNRFSLLYPDSIFLANLFINTDKSKCDYSTIINLCRFYDQKSTRDKNRIRRLVVQVINDCLFYLPSKAENMIEDMILSCPLQVKWDIYSIPWTWSVSQKFNFLKHLNRSTSKDDLIFALKSAVAGERWKIAKKVISMMDNQSLNQSIIIEIIGDLNFSEFRWEDALLSYHKLIKRQDIGKDMLSRIIVKSSIVCYKQNSLECIHNIVSLLEPLIDKKDFKKDGKGSSISSSLKSVINADAESAIILAIGAISGKREFVLQALHKFMLSDFNRGWIEHQEGVSDILLKRMISIINEKESIAKNNNSTVFDHLIFLIYRLYSPLTSQFAIESRSFSETLTTGFPSLNNFSSSLFTFSILNEIFDEKSVNLVRLPRGKFEVIINNEGEKYINTPPKLLRFNEWVKIMKNKDNYIDGFHFEPMNARQMISDMNVNSSLSSIRNYDIDHAIERLEESIEFDHKNIYAFEILTKLYSSTDEFDLCLDRANHAIELGSKDKMTFFLQKKCTSYEISTMLIVIILIVFLIILIIMLVLSSNKHQYQVAKRIKKHLKFS